MRLLDNYALPPGCCFHCRAAQRPNEEAVLDLERDAEDGSVFDARIYLCKECCMEIADRWGCAPPALRSRLVRERDEAIAEAARLLERNSELEAANLALAAVGPEPGFTIAATAEFMCPECLVEGEMKDCKNAQGLSAHRRHKHGKAHIFVEREEVDA